MTVLDMRGYMDADGDKPQEEWGHSSCVSLGGQICIALPLGVFDGIRQIQRLQPLDDGALESAHGLGINRTIGDSQMMAWECNARCNVCIQECL